MVYKNKKSLTVYLRLHISISKYDEYSEREVLNAMGTLNRGPNTVKGGGGGQGRAFVFIFYYCHKFSSLEPRPSIVSQFV